METKTLSGQFLLKFPAPVLTLFLGLAGAFCPGHLRAEIALSFTGGSSNNTSNNITHGWAFSLSNPVLLTDLGFWDFGSDGLLGSYPVAPTFLPFPDLS